MKTDTDNKAVLSDGRAAGVVSVVVSDVLNVTWRMAVPTVIGIAVGYFVGQQLGHQTVGFLTGAVIGFATGLYMALRLLNAVRGGSKS